MYIIFSTVYSGWVTATGVYTSDADRAKRFTFDDALEACKLHYTVGGFAGEVFSWVPVRDQDLEAVRGNAS